MDQRPHSITPQDLWDYAQKAQEEVKKFTLEGNVGAAVQWAKEYGIRYTSYVHAAATSNEQRIKFGKLFPG